MMTLRVYDVRPIDFDSGKRLDLPIEQLPTCDRCGRRHAKVVELTPETAAERAEWPAGALVGTGCAEWLGASTRAINRGLDRDSIRAELLTIRGEAIAKVTGLPLGVVREEFNRIKLHRLTTWQQYRQANRAGSTTPLGTRQRKAIWGMFDSQELLTR